MNTLTLLALLLSFLPGPRHTDRIVVKVHGADSPAILHVSAASVPQAVAFLRAQPEVEFAEEDMEIPPDFIPADPGYASQWHHAKIGDPLAWDSARGTGVIIAICDTGCDPTHRDLAASYVPGWNFYDNSSNTADVYGHGTATAGTAAAIGNNGIGVTGVAFNAFIMPNRISGPNGYASYTAAAAAVRYAADHGARVANISYQMSESLTLQDAAAYARSKGCVVVISAGNTAAVSTAANPSQILTVGSTNSADTMSSFSVRGTIVDLYAPGEYIYTTTRGGGYGSWSGTSFSAPVVAGTAALVLSAHPDYSATDAIAAIQGSCDFVNGIKRVNDSKAVSALVMHVADPSYGGGGKGGGRGHAK